MSTTDPTYPDEPLSTLSAEEKQWGMFAHLSIVVATAVGGMIFLGPLIIWLIKKDQSEFIKDQGREALNFSLNILLAMFVVGVAGIPFTLLTGGLGVFLVGPLLAGLGALAIIMPIIGGVKANAGEAYHYPFIIRFVT